MLRDARAEADEVVAVLLSSGLSGTFASAQAAVRAAGISGVHLVDSRSASLGLGMLALRGAELAESGWTGGRHRRASSSGSAARPGMLLTVDRYDNLLRSGRVSRGKAWIAGMLDVKPILSLDAAGRVVPVDRVRGRDNVVPRVLALLEQAPHAAPNGGTIRGGARRGPGGGRAGSDRAGGGVPAAGLLRHAGHRRAGHPRGARGLGHLLPGRGRPPPASSAGRDAGTDAMTQTPEALRLALDAIQDLKGESSSWYSTCEG